MHRQDWLVSILVVAVVALKIAEGVYRLEAWPLSSVKMFSRRIPPEWVPCRIVLLSLYPRHPALQGGRIAKGCQLDGGPSRAAPVRGFSLQRRT
jgi:hypothetical protein